jgi:hypothetical protein
VIGIFVRQLEMQALLPQPPQASKAHMDCYVPQATQKGKILIFPFKVIILACILVMVTVSEAYLHLCL